jgi:hypothetical protein
MLYLVYQKVPRNANSYLNRLQHGSVAAGCVACSLCAHAWKVAPVCSVLSCLSEGVAELSGAMSQFEQRADT